MPIESGGRPFEVRAERRDGAVILEFVGELDLTGHDEAAAALAEAVAAAPRAVVVNLERLSFMDSTGLRCLLEAKLLADAKGARMAIVNGAGPPLRLLELTRMDGVIEMVDDLTQFDPPAVSAP
jgi:anti-sigma B factor antagonist